MEPEEPDEPTSSVDAGAQPQTPSIWDRFAPPPGTDQQSFDNQLDLASTIGRSRRKRRMATLLDAEKAQESLRKPGGVFDILTRRLSRNASKDAQSKEAADKLSVPLRVQRSRNTKPNRLQAPAKGYHIGVVSAQGRAGKTTLATIIASLLARHHKDPVALLEANLGAGAASLRLGLEPVATASQLARSIQGVTRLADIQEVALHSPDGLDLVVSDDNMELSDWLSEKEYTTIADILKRFYSVIITDTSTGYGSPYTLAALEAVDRLVVCCTTDREAGPYILYTLDCLAQLHPDLVANSLVTAFEMRPGTLSSFGGTLAALQERCHTVFLVPYSEQLAHGGSIQLDRLQEDFSDLFMDVAVALADQFTRKRSLPDTKAAPVAP